MKRIEVVMKKKKKLLKRGNWYGDKDKKLKKSSQLSSDIAGYDTDENETEE